MRSWKNIRRGLIMMRNIFWKVGVLGEYRKRVLAIRAGPADAQGDIEGLHRIGRDRAPPDHVRARGLERPAERVELFAPPARRAGPGRVIRLQSRRRRRDRLGDLRELTPARVALGRSGASLPTRALLDFTLDHARARDAVHAAFDAAALIDRPRRARPSRRRRCRAAPPTAGNISAVPISAAGSIRPRRSALPVAGRGRGGLAIVIGDGLSPTAVHAHAIALMRELLPRLAAANIGIGRVVVATGARVALGDEIGEILERAAWSRS